MSSASAATNTPLQHIHQITVPTPFPVGPVHVYLLEGSCLTLVDTGPFTPAALQTLQRGLSQLGYAVADLDRIVITHAHSDHFGLVGDLIARSNAQVCSHRWAQPAVEGWQAYFAGRERFWAGLLHAAGVPEDRAAASAHLYNSFRQLQTPAPVDCFLADGDLLAMAGKDWRVLHCPGHSGSLICLHEPTSHLLIGSDHLLGHISSNAIVEPPEVGQQERRKPLLDYWRSLDRVYEIDLDQVLTGHGDIVNDHRALITRRLGFYDRRLSQLLAELATGTQTAWQLAGHIFASLDRVDTFLAISEIIGHLDVLEARGKITVESDSDGVWRYRQVVENGV